MDNKDIMNNEESTNEEFSLPSIKKEENSNVEQEEKQIKGRDQTTDPSVDFSAIFNVASEETPVEQPKPAQTESKPTEEKPAQIEVPEAEEKKPEPKFNKDMFNSEEKLLYEIKPEKEGNPIVVLFFFIFLIAFIILLPSISKKMETYKPKETPKEEEVVDESKMYELGSTAVRVAIGDIELNNFVVNPKGDNKYLTFTLTNNSAEPYTYNKKYYIELYEGESRLGYALIHDYNIVSAYGAQEVNLIITERMYSRADHFKVVEISPNLYPAVTTTELEGEYEVITCKYKNDEMKYYFSNNSLIKIRETYHEEQGSTPNYNSNKTAHNNEHERLDKVEGIDSTFVETITNYTLINEIELSGIPDKTLSDLKVYRFFKYSETKQAVSFELQAQGYSCSR